MRRWPYILVVDDDADFRAGLRAALEMKGYQVDEAANGEEALLRLADKPPLLVLLDLQMPVEQHQERRLVRSEEHTSELQSRRDLVCRLRLEKKNTSTGLGRPPRWRVPAPCRRH